MSSDFHIPDPDLPPHSPESGEDEEAYLPRGVRILDDGDLRELEDGMIARGGDPFVPGTKGIEFDQRTWSGCLLVLAAGWLFVIIAGVFKATAGNPFPFGALGQFLVWLVILCAWAVVRTRRAWVVIEPDRIRLRNKVVFFVRDRIYPLRDVDGVALAQDEGGKYSVGLALKSGGEATLISAGNSLDKACWLTATLGRELGLRVDMGRHLVDRAAFAGKDRDSVPLPAVEATAPVDEVPPPRGFASFPFDSPEFIGSAPRLEVDDAGPGDFAVRQRHFQIFVIGFLCFWLGGVLVGVILSDDYFLRRLGTAFLYRNLFETIFQFIFSIGWLLALGSLVFTIFGSTWFVFLRDRLVIGTRLVFFVSKKIIPRDRIAAVNRERQERRKGQWKLQLLLADGRVEELVSDPQNLRPDEFRGSSGGRVTKWMENVVLAWLGRNADVGDATLAGAGAPSLDGAGDGAAGSIGLLDELPPGVSVLPPERIREIAPKFDPVGVQPFALGAIGVEFVLFPDFRRLYVVAEAERIRYRKEISFHHRSGSLLVRELRAVVFSSSGSGGCWVGLEPAIGDDVTLLAESGDNGRARWLAAFLSRRYRLPLKGDRALPGPRWGGDEVF